MLHVTCSIIVQNEKILICQRSARMKLPMKWEFPGGKIELGESKEECLKREIREELGIEINIDKALTPIKYHYPTFSICLYPYICTFKSGTLQATEHAQTIWVDKKDLINYDWAEADIPIVNEYVNL